MIELNSVELEVLDANMLTFCCLMEVKASCPVCVHIHLPWSDLRDWRSSVKHTVVFSQGQGGGKEKWEFLFSTFLRQDTVNS